MIKQLSIFFVSLVLGLTFLGTPSLAQADGCQAIDRSISHYGTEIPKFPRYCSLVALIRVVFNVLFSAIAMVTIIFIIIGGYRYMTARGNEEQATAGRKTVVYALAGFIVVVLSVTLVNIIVNLILFGRTI